jgi:hypothetical protein
MTKKNKCTTIRASFDFFFSSSMSKRKSEFGEADILDICTHPAELDADTLNKLRLAAAWKYGIKRAYDMPPHVLCNLLLNVLGQKPRKVGPQTIETSTFPLQDLPDLTQQVVFEQLFSGLSKPELESALYQYGTLSSSIAPNVRSAVRSLYGRAPDTPTYSEYPLSDYNQPDPPCPVRKRCNSKPDYFDVPWKVIYFSHPKDQIVSDLRQALQQENTMDDIVLHCSCVVVQFPLHPVFHIVTYRMLRSNTPSITMYQLLKFCIDFYWDQKITPDMAQRMLHLAREEFDKWITSKHISIDWKGNPINKEATFLSYFLREQRSMEEFTSGNMYIRDLFYWEFLYVIQPDLGPDAVWYLSVQIKQ